MVKIFAQSGLEMGETNDKKCTSNGYLHTIKEKQHFVTMFEHLDVSQCFSHSTICRLFVYWMYYNRLLIWIQKGSIKYLASTKSF